MSVIVSFVTDQHRVGYWVRQQHSIGSCVTDQHSIGSCVRHQQCWVFGLHINSVGFLGYSSTVLGLGLLINRVGSWVTH